MPLPAEILATIPEDIRGSEHIAAYNDVGSLVKDLIGTKTADRAPTTTVVPFAIWSSAENGPENRVERPMITVLPPWPGMGVPATSPAKSDGGTDAS